MDIEKIINVSEFFVVAVVVHSEFKFHTIEVTQDKFPSAHKKHS